MQLHCDDSKQKKVIFAIDDDELVLAVINEKGHQYYIFDLKHKDISKDKEEVFTFRSIPFGETSVEELDEIYPDIEAAVAKEAAAKEEAAKEAAKEAAAKEDAKKFSELVECKINGEGDFEYWNITIGLKDKKLYMVKEDNEDIKRTADLIGCEVSQDLPEDDLPEDIDDESDNNFLTVNLSGE